MNRYKPVGWRNDNYRHSLAAKGIRTSMASIPKGTFRPSTYVRAYKEGARGAGVSLDRFSRQRAQQSRPIGEIVDFTPSKNLDLKLRAEVVRRESAVRRSAEQESRLAEKNILKYMVDGMEPTQSEKFVSYRDRMKKALEKYLPRESYADDVHYTLALQKEIQDKYLIAGKATAKDLENYEFDNKTKKFIYSKEYIDSENKRNAEEDDTDDLTLFT